MRGGVRIGGCVVALLLLAGCDGESDDARPTPTTQSSTTVGPTTETTPTEPVEPTLPPEAEGSSPKAAKAFVGYYIELLNYAMVTGDTDAFRAAARGCGGCEAYSRLFEKQYANGGSNVTDGWRPTSIVVTRDADGRVALADVVSAPLEYIKRAGAEPTMFDRDTYSLRFVLGQSRAGWYMTEFTGGDA